MIQQVEQYLTFGDLYKRIDIDNIDKNSLYVVTKQQAACIDLKIPNTLRLKDQRLSQLPVGNVTRGIAVKTSDCVAQTDQVLTFETVEGQTYLIEINGLTNCYDNIDPNA